MNPSQLFLILRARAWIILVGLILGIAGAVAANLLLPKYYTATATVVIDSKTTDALTGANLPAPLIQTQLEIMRSERVALQVINTTKLTESPVARKMYEDKTQGRGSITHWWAERLQKNLDLQNRRDSNVVDIAFSAPDPRFAAAIANAFSKAYIDTTLELTLQPARLSATWFDEQLKDLRTNLETAQKRLMQTQQKYGIVATEERLDVETQRLTELSSQLTTAQGEARDSATRRQSALRFVKDGTLPEQLPDVLSSPLVQSIKSDLLKAEAKLQEISTRMQVNHPVYQSQLSDVQSLREKLVQEIHSLANSHGTAAALSGERQAKLTRAMEDQKQKLLNLKRQHDEISVLKGEISSAQRAYDAAAMRFTQTNLASRGSQTNVAILNPAVEPTEHSSPREFRNLLVGIIAGLVLGLNLVVLVEARDRRIRSGDDFTSEIGLPVLASIERSGKGSFDRFMSSVRHKGSPRKNSVLTRG
jgi:polysaccharide biosynthesis transport protein